MPVAQGSDPVATAAALQAAYAAGRVRHAAAFEALRAEGAFVAPAERRPAAQQELLLDPALRLDAPSAQDA